MGTKFNHERRAWYCGSSEELEKGVVGAVKMVRVGNFDPDIRFVMIFLCLHMGSLEAAQLETAVLMVDKPTLANNPPIMRMPKRSGSSIERGVLNNFPRARRDFAMGYCYFGLFEQVISTLERNGGSKYRTNVPIVSLGWCRLSY